MPYAIVLSPDADAHLAKLAPLIQSKILDELERLGQSPTALSRPPHFPYEPYHQMFKAQFVADGHEQFMIALFKYHANEEEIHVGALICHEGPPV